MNRGIEQVAKETTLNSVITTAYGNRAIFASNYKIKYEEIMIGIDHNDESCEQMNGHNRPETTRYDSRRNSKLFSEEILETPNQAYQKTPPP